MGPHRRNRVFEFFNVTAPVRIALCEVASQKGAPRAGAAKKAEAAKWSQSGRAGQSKPSKHQKTGPVVLTLILESPTATEEVIQRSVPEVLPSSGPLAAVPIQSRPAEAAPSQPSAMVPQVEHAAPTSVVRLSHDLSAPVKRSVDPFDVSYSDPEDNDDNVEVGAKVKNGREEVATEVLQLLPSPSASKASSSSSLDRSSRGKTASSPDSSQQLEVAAKGGTGGGGGAK